MFGGIVAAVGRVRSVRSTNRALRIEIESELDLHDASVGASVLCAGCCLTLIDKADGWFAVEAIAETLACSTAGTWREGSRVNLERPLRLGGMLDGHIVAGHVDGKGQIVSIAPEEGSHRLRVCAPQSLRTMIANKGSIALDGVSLTVAAVENAEFEVCIIPHTLDVTTLSELAPGSCVNLEVDLLARYAARARETQSAAVES